MMGERRVMQEALFYGFSLERHVPDSHLLRKIDRFVDLSEVRTHLEPYYSETGRPSIDPELMMRMLIVGYCFGIRSERRLCEEVHLNLAYRWFCGLGLDGDVPDHSTFSKNRHGRFRESDLLRLLFEAILRRCIDLGLVGGERFAVDASLIRADANRQNGVEGEAPKLHSRAGMVIGRATKSVPPIRVIFVRLHFRTLPKCKADKCSNRAEDESRQKPAWHHPIRCSGPPQLAASFIA